MPSNDDITELFGDDMARLVEAQKTTSRTSYQPPVVDERLPVAPAMSPLEQSAAFEVRMDKEREPYLKIIGLARKTFVWLRNHEVPAHPLAACGNRPSLFFQPDRRPRGWILLNLSVQISVSVATNTPGPSWYGGSDTFKQEYELCDSSRIEYLALTTDGRLLFKNELYLNTCEVALRFELPDPAPKRLSESDISIDYRAWRALPAPRYLPYMEAQVARLLERSR